MRVFFNKIYYFRKTVICITILIAYPFDNLYNYFIIAAGSILKGCIKLVKACLAISVLKNSFIVAGYFIFIALREMKCSIFPLICVGQPEMFGQ